MACISTPQAAFGNSDYDIFVAQVPSPLFQRRGTAFGDAGFDLFAAQVPSPLLQRIRTAYSGVLTVATVASEAVVESPRMPRRRRVPGQRPYHSRVMMSSSSESSSSLLSMFTDSSMKVDPCGICGQEDASRVLLHCEGGVCCTATVHLQCLRSRVRRKLKGKWRCEACKSTTKLLLIKQKNKCIFLDLEAGHSGRNGVCDNTNADESQGSLVDFIYDENSSEESDDQENEVDMANIYLTSLLPLSQQPQGFGFCAPKYNNRGFKLRKTEVLSVVAYR